MIEKIEHKIDLEYEITNKIIKENNYYKIDNLKNFVENIITGTTPSTKDNSLWGNELDFITIPDMQNNIYILNTERKLSHKCNNIYLTRLIPQNSLIVSCIATVGLVSINANKAMTNQQINSIIFRNKDDIFYYYEYFKNKKSYLIQLGSGGSATLNINKNIFSNIEITIPDEIYLKGYINKVKPMFNLIKHLKKENLKLDELKQLYLKKFFG